MRPPILPPPARKRGQRPGIILRPRFDVTPSAERCAAPDCGRALNPDTPFPKRFYASFGLAPAGFCGVKCVENFNWQVLIPAALGTIERDGTGVQLGPMVSNTLPHSKETPCPELRPPHVLTLPPPRTMPPEAQ